MAPDHMRMTLRKVSHLLTPLEHDLVNVLIWARAHARPGFAPKMLWLARRLGISVRWLRVVIGRLEAKTQALGLYRFRTFVFGELRGHTKDEHEYPMTQRENVFRITALLRCLCGAVDAEVARKAASGVASETSPPRSPTCRDGVGIDEGVGSAPPTTPLGAPSAPCVADLYADGAERELRRLGCWPSVARKWKWLPGQYLEPCIAELRNRIREGTIYRNISSTLKGIVVRRSVRWCA